nr:hypothetical protein CFP56_58186 [Quercus suber]
MVMFMTQLLVLIVAVPQDLELGHVRQRVLLVARGAAARQAALVRMQLHVDEQGVQADVVDQATGAGGDERDPEAVAAGEQAGHRGPGGGGQRAQHAGDAHDGGALGGLDDGGDEGGARGLVHVVEAGADEQQQHRQPQGRGQREEQHGGGRGDVREDHGVDEADAARQRAREDARHGRQEHRDAGHVAERGFGRVELGVHVVGRQRVGHHAVRDRVQGEQGPQLVHDGAGGGGDPGQPVAEPARQSFPCPWRWIEGFRGPARGTVLHLDARIIIGMTIVLRHLAVRSLRGRSGFASLRQEQD